MARRYSRRSYRSSVRRRTGRRAVRTSARTRSSSVRRGQTVRVVIQQAPAATAVPYGFVPKPAPRGRRY